MFTTKELVKVAMMTTLIIILGFIPAIPLGFIGPYCFTKLRHHVGWIDVGR